MIINRGYYYKLYVVLCIVFIRVTNTEPVVHTIGIKRSAVVDRSILLEE